MAILSAGQCGTEWLASGIRSMYPQLEVEHEPIGALYKPRSFFRCYDDPETILEVPEVARHVERIEQAENPYVETGWPLFAALPLLARRLGSRLRVVHLTRHPVPTALLHLASGHYADSERDDPYSSLATLGARDRNVFQSYYTGCWEQLTPYERCLFWWTEVNLFAIEFPGRNAEVPFLRLKSEDLLTGHRETLEQLLEFAGLPWEPGWLDHSRDQVDRWHEHTEGHVDALEVHRHPTTVEVARQLGYDVSHLNRGELEAHYRGQPFAEMDQLDRSA